MKPEDLIDAIGEIDEKLLRETDEIRQKQRSRHKRWSRLWKITGIAAAACFCVVIGYSFSHIRMDSSAPAMEAVRDENSRNYMSGEAAGEDGAYDGDSVEEAEALDGKYLCTLSDYDADIYIYGDYDATADEMTYEEALKILAENGWEWYIVTGEDADEGLFDEMTAYAEENGYDKVLENLIN